jgi:type IV secretory pathway VirB4 component
MILPTFSLIKVREIRNDVYILENGGLRAVLKVSGLNFSLLSEKEQEITIGQFKNFLDGLDFPVEILILSRLENINDYLKALHLRLEEEKDPLIKFQLEEYVSFLEDYLQNHKIMKKIFYIIVPYDPLEVSLGPLSKIKKPAGLEESEETKFEQLETRINYVVDALINLGLVPERLSDLELIELLFEVYNPNLRWQQLPKQIVEKLAETL